MASYCSDHNQVVVKCTGRTTSGIGETCLTGNSELNLIITNRHPSDALDAHIALHDFDPSADVRVQTLTGESFISQNEWDSPDKVKLRELSLKMDGTELNYPVPAHSIVLLTFSRKKD